MTESGNGANLQGEYAGVASRGAALFIDTAILAVTFAVSDLLIELGLKLLSLELDSVVGSRWVWTVFMATYGAAIGAVYYGFFWSALGQTPGNLIMGLKVVRLDGNLLSPLKAVLRYLAYSLSSILLLGFALALVTHRRQTLHDKLVGSVVVYAWNAKHVDGRRWANLRRTAAPNSDNSR